MSHSLTPTMIRRPLEILLLLLLPMQIQAQGMRPMFRGLSVSNGLSDLCANEIYKDSLGFIWVGTDMGVDRFDGFYIRNFPIPGADTNRKRVNAIHAYRGKVLLVGNNTGLWTVNAVTGEYVRIDKQLINCAVNDICQVGSTFYIATAKGLFTFRNGACSHPVYPGKNVLSASNHVTRLSLDRRGTLWMSTMNGLFALREGRAIQAYRNPAGTQQFSNLTCIGDQIYLGTMDQGLYVFNQKTHRFAKGPNVGCNVISSLSSDGRQTVYVATDGNGVHFISARTGEIVNSFTHAPNATNLIRSNSVYSLLVDREGLIWIGFYQSGLDYTLYQSNLFHPYAFGTFNSTDYVVRAFSINGPEKLIGTRDGLFFIKEDRNEVHVYTTPQLRSKLILAVKRYRGHYYIGTYGGGMYVLDPQTGTVNDFSSSDPVFRNGHIFKLADDGKGNLWIGTSDGLYRLNGKGALQTYNHRNSALMDGNVYEIFFDSQHKGWICTENGMAIFDPASQTISTDIFPDGFIHHVKIRQVYETRHHQLLFLPDKGRIMTSSLNMSNLRELEMPTAIDDASPMFVVEDGEGYLWVASTQHLMRMSGGRYTLYNYSDGIPSETFSLNAYYREPGGRLWFGNASGLLSVDPKDIEHATRHPYPIYITEVIADGTSYQQDLSLKPQQPARLSLPSGTSNVVFRFTCPEYTDPSSFSFEYRLEGHDREWRFLTGKNEVNYYNLDDGTYTFVCRLPGNDKVCTRITVTIGYPLWAKIGLFMLLIATAYLLWRFIIKRYGKKLKRAVKAFYESENKAEKEKYKTSTLKEAECRQLATQLRQCMEEQRPYINPDLKLNDLAKMSNISSYNMSYLFSQYMQVSYYDYVNEYRINAFKQMVKAGGTERYTLEAMAEKCGFSSRTSFFRSFKKVTGETPNEYIKRLKKSSDGVSNN